MLIEMLQCKVHGLTCTQTDLHYQGSITLDVALVQQAGWIPGQKVQVVNVNTGGRLETYLIEAPRHSGVACLNGPAARMATVGDILHVIAYLFIEKDAASKHVPKLVHVDKQNKPTK